MTRWLAAALGLLVTAVVAVVWVVPAIVGPSVECGGTPAAVCEEMWHSAAAAQADVYGIPAGIRPISVLVDATPMAGGSYCPSYIRITWSNGRETDVNSLC